MTSVESAFAGQTATQIPLADRLSRPITVITGLCAAQILFWTLAPTVASSAPPLDVVENSAWGPEWLLSSYKNPALSSWCLELSRLVTGASGWPAYLVSQLFVSLTFVLVFLLGREPLGQERALAGTLLLTGVYYFSWPTPEFNQDIAQMPLWAGVALALWRATETNRLGWWILLALFAAASTYAKLSAVVLLIPAAAWIVLEPKARQLIPTLGPWIAAALFVAATTPLIVWLVNDGFLPISYAVPGAELTASLALVFFLPK
jgi:4-amino-4-deoxy-L-arabinose transferase-like glycosyltransferase